ncbi:uncharacterized protein LOC133308706 [Gastrolobium bilobum]|uniref:uncharacterized protein LOC133308706 n=1 Tax=Gastrolobium bilobum TaxID=150636 RepID=UPI002AB2B88B|nr:uncharacterized protein LOC133308706 [Gastrolobium bilobum]
MEISCINRNGESGEAYGLDRPRYCTFHDGPGHTIDECWDLRDPGRRKKQTEDNKGKKAKSNSNEFLESEFECNVINRALGGRGESSSVRRKYLREVLSVREREKFKEDSSKPEPPLLYFTKEKLRDVVMGHEDGLIITNTLVNYCVKKIFVDPGSCADILLWDAFKRMNVDEEDLKPCKTMLIAFNGEKNPTKRIY